MKYALGNMLNGGIQGLDPAAKAYINAIVGAGASVSGAQRTAINNFYKSAKTDGYYNQVKRLYLPIWGVAAPNAVDLITTTSGTFVGGVTHSSGFVQGNDSNAYFNYQATPNGVGLSVGNSSVFSLLLEKPSIKPFGLLVPAALKSIGFAAANSTAIGYSCGQVGTSSSVTDSTQNGIYIASELASNSRYCRVRRTSGVTNLQTNTTETGTSAYPSSNMLALCGGNPTPYSYSNAKLGAYGIGLVLTTTQADAYTLALKNLWETCTGLTLP